MSELFVDSSMEDRRRGSTDNECGSLEWLSIMLAVSVPVFAVAVWLGCQLFNRDPAKPLLRRMAVGLLAYALAIPSADVPQLAVFLLGVPAIAWTGVLLRLAPAENYYTLDKIWVRGYVPATTLALAAVALASSRWWAAGVFGLLLLGLTAPLVWLLAVRANAVITRGLLAVVTITFGLGLAGLLLGLELLPSTVLLVGIGVDLVVLALLVAWSDAVEEGHRLRVDMGRSGLAAAVVALVFGAQVVLAMMWGPGATPALTLLLYGCVGAAIVIQVWAGPLQRATDRATMPAPMRRQRAELRDAIEAVPRVSALEGAADSDFATWTRRALSNYADLGKLMSSPLTQLPLIDERLRQREAVDLPVERAAELKTLLREGIERLKPDGDFGLSDEWRHYNSLYFIYVVGLRPYSQRARHHGLTAREKQVLEWFRVTVPQRSLHNWQNTAARLVADTLRQK